MFTKIVNVFSTIMMALLTVLVITNVLPPDKSLLVGVCIIAFTEMVIDTVEAFTKKKTFTASVELDEDELKRIIDGMDSGDVE